MNLCIKCIHIIPGAVPQCGRTSRQSPVTGERKHFNCWIERAYDEPGGCGPEGRHFEARESERSAILKMETKP